MVHLTQPFANPDNRDVLARAWVASEPYRRDPAVFEDHEAASIRPRQHRLGDEEVLQIVEEYEAGASQAVLAERYGVHRTTIMRLLEREEARTRRKVRKLTDGQVQEAARLYESGMSLAKVAVQLRVGSSTVRRELVKAGVKLRSK